MKTFFLALLVLLSLSQISQSLAASPVGTLNLPLPHPNINSKFLPSSSSTSALYQLYDVVLKLGKAAYLPLNSIWTKLSEWFQTVTGVTTGNLLLDIWNTLLWLLDNVLKVLHALSAWANTLGK